MPSKKPDKTSVSGKSKWEPDKSQAELCKLNLNRSAKPIDIQEKTPAECLMLESTRDEVEEAVQLCTDQNPDKPPSDETETAGKEETTAEEDILMFLAEAAENERKK